MNKMEKSLSAIFRSIFYIFISVACALIFIQFCLPIIEQMQNSYEIIGISYKFKAFIVNILKFSLDIFCVVFFAMSTILFAVKAIYNFWLFFYYQLFYNDNYTKIQVTVDEENRITDSYLEFKNGDRVPLFITKIVGNKINEVEEKVKPSTENTNNGEK